MHILFAHLLIPLVVNADTIKGKLEGLTCLLKGYICPLDEADPMINLEKAAVHPAAFFCLSFQKINLSLPRE